MTAVPGRGFQPIVDRLDQVGLIAHARGTVPAADLGHSTDAAGLALALAATHPDDEHAGTVAASCLAQLERSATQPGGFVSGLDENGRPATDPADGHTVELATARAVWGLSVASTSRLDPAVRSDARRLLDAVGSIESASPPAAAHAVLAGLHLADHGHPDAGRALIARNRRAIPVPAVHDPSTWRWPEPELSGGSAIIAEAMIALAAFDHDQTSFADALDLLTWLIRRERRDDGHFSFTPVSGRMPGEPTQRPIEAWTIASACARACLLTGGREWAQIGARALSWFDGDNDVGRPVWDRASGAAFDGLTGSGVSPDAGAEASLALIGTVHAAIAASGYRWSPRRSRLGRIPACS